LRCHHAIRSGNGLALDCALNNPAAALWLRQRRQFAHTLGFYVARLFHILRGRFHQLAIGIGGEARLIRVHRLRHANRTALQKRYSCSGRRQLG
jgi:hypothetical protein